MIHPQTILEFQKQVFQKLIQIGKEVYINSKIFGLLIVISSHPPYITQLEIGYITEWSATMISDTLNPMIRLGLITTCKIPNSRKRGYKLFGDLFSVYESNFQRLLTQVKQVISIPIEIEEETMKLMKQYPKSPMIIFFKTYLTIFQKYNNEILKLTSSISLSKPNELPLDEIEQNVIRLSTQFTTKLSKSEEFIKRLQNEFPNEPLELFDKLDHFMRKYLVFFRNLMQQSERDVEAGVILNCFFINYYPLTQDRIIYLSDIPRSSLSTQLHNFIEKKMVMEIHESQSRKKRYHIAFPREYFMLFKQITTLKISIQMEKIITKIKSQFLSAFGQISSTQISGFRNFLEQTELAYRRMNYQLFYIVQKLADMEYL